MGAVLAVEAIQLAGLLVIAWLVLGWTPAPGASLGLAVVAVVLGTAAFAGLGLLLAGALRAEATLALANALFIAALLLGGIILPLDHLPDALAVIAGVLPAAALSDALRSALGTGGRPHRPAGDPGRLGRGRDRPHRPHLPLGVGRSATPGRPAGRAAGGPVTRPARARRRPRRSSPRTRSLQSQAKCSVGVKKGEVLLAIFWARAAGRARMRRERSSLNLSARRTRSR